MGADMPDIAPMAKTKKNCVHGFVNSTAETCKNWKKKQDHLVDDALKDSLSNTF